MWPQGPPTDRMTAEKSDLVMRLKKKQPIWKEKTTQEKLVDRSPYPYRLKGPQDTLIASRMTALQLTQAPHAQRPDTNQPVTPFLL